jgi:hypothetical protein
MGSYRRRARVEPRPRSPEEWPRSGGRRAGERPCGLWHTPYLVQTTMIHSSSILTYPSQHQESLCPSHRITLHRITSRTGGGHSAHDVTVQAELVGIVRHRVDVVGLVTYTERCAYIHVHTKNIHLCAYYIIYTLAGVSEGVDV